MNNPVLRKEVAPIQGATEDNSVQSGPVQVAIGGKMNITFQTPGTRSLKEIRDAIETVGKTTSGITRIEDLFSQDTSEHLEKAA